jgi:hypothetical protein
MDGRNCILIEPRLSRYLNTSTPFAIDSAMAGAIPFEIVPARRREKSTLRRLKYGHS